MRLKMLGVFAVTALVAAESGLAARAALPSRLSDSEFWNLIQELSEPNGDFRSDNLVSDEKIFRDVVPELTRRPRGTGAYIGVGPEQNFTYIAALEPPMAFVLDIRRGNLHLQLLYKALFELSADRAEFVSRLFVKPRPAALKASSSVSELIDAYWHTNTNTDAFRQHLDAVMDVLVTRHQLPLSAEDRQGIEKVYYNFYWFGPSIRWDSTSSPRSAQTPMFVDLIGQVDANGRELSFLSTESRFAFVKNLEAKNLVVPIVGNFAGPKALRAIGQYVRDHGATVDAFYVSEVEAYLLNDGTWPAFCGNVATLPVQDRSILIRPSLTQFNVSDSKTTGIPTALRESFTAKQARLVPIAPEVSGCPRSGNPVGR